MRAWPVVGVARLEKGEPLGGEIREGVSNRSVNEDTTLWQREMIGGRGDLDRLEGVARWIFELLGDPCVCRGNRGAPFRVSVDPDRSPGDRELDLPG